MTDGILPTIDLEQDQPLLPAKTTAAVRWIGCDKVGIAPCPLQERDDIPDVMEINVASCGLHEICSNPLGRDVGRHLVADDALHRPTRIIDARRRRPETRVASSRAVSCSMASPE